MKRTINLCVAFLFVCAAALTLGAGPEAAKPGQQKSAWMPQFEMLKKLEGVWVKPDDKDSKTALVFHTTASNTVVVETMFPGQKHEMVNTYHLDGDDLVMTHYCASGNQPHMKIVEAKGNSLKFGFVSCSNNKDAGGCMGGLEMIIDGDKLTERWSYLDHATPEGKLGEPEVFEFHRKS